DSTRKTARSGLLKSSVGSIVANSSPTPAEAPTARRQNTGSKKTIKIKPAVVPVTSKHESIHGESSTNNNNGGVTNLTAFINKHMEEFKDILLSSQ
ncbi:hypothetical protein H8356DRAFT_961991, partial [Neocallimastix lanati (nom. inval.)]